MYPSQIRQEILRSQRSILQRFEVLEALASAPCPVTAEALRTRSAELVPQLIAHIQLDDTLLAPALADTDAWRAFRIERLEAHHDHQREGILQLITQLTDESADAEGLCQLIRSLAATLKRDFDEEARLMLSSDVLRDDVISLGVGA